MSGVLLGETFADICMVLWGPDWKAPAEKRLKRSRCQLRNLELGHNNVSRRLRLELLSIVEEQIAVLDGYRRELL